MARTRIRARCPATKCAKLAGADLVPPRLPAGGAEGPGVVAPRDEGNPASTSEHCTGPRRGPGTLAVTIGDASSYRGFLPLRRRTADVHAAHRAGASHGAAFDSPAAQCSANGGPGSVNRLDGGSSIVR